MKYKACAWVAALLALAGVFTAYLQPEFTLMAANWIWSCF